MCNSGVYIWQSHWPKQTQRCVYTDHGCQIAFDILTEWQRPDCDEIQRWRTFKMRNVKHFFLDHVVGALLQLNVECVRKSIQPYCVTGVSCHVRFYSYTANTEKLTHSQHDDASFPFGLCVYVIFFLLNNSPFHFRHTTAERVVGHLPQPWAHQTPHRNKRRWNIHVLMLRAYCHSLQGLLFNEGPAAGLNFDRINSQKWWWTAYRRTFSYLFTQRYRSHGFFFLVPDAKWTNGMLFIRIILHSIHAATRALALLRVFFLFWFRFFS